MRNSITMGRPVLVSARDRGAQIGTTGMDRAFTMESAA
jgi:hypothetical protein